MEYVIQKPVSALGLYLLEEIKQRGWSQARLAELAGVTPAAISQLINRPNRKPDYATLEGLAKALETEPYTLMSKLRPEPAQPAEKAA